jgi:hypothetical protein
MQNFRFWKRWLFSVSIGIIVFGLFISIFSSSNLFAFLFNSHYNPVFWGVDPVPENTQRYQQWVYAVWGSTIAGWGILIAFVSYFAFSPKERWSWISLASMTGIWYFLDTIISFGHGVYFNVGLNTVFLALLSLPLIFTRNDFFTQRKKAVVKDYHEDSL